MFTQRRKDGSSPPMISTSQASEGLCSNCMVELVASSAIREVPTSDHSQLILRTRLLSPVQMLRQLNLLLRNHFKTPRNPR